MWTHGRWVLFHNLGCGIYQKRNGKGQLRLSFGVVDGGMGRRWKRDGGSFGEECIKWYQIKPDKNLNYIYLSVSYMKHFRGKCTALLKL